MASPHNLKTVGVQVVTLGLLAVVVSGCGSSSTSVTGPSPNAVRCPVTVAEPSSMIGAEGGSGSLTVSAARECSWSAASEVNWIVITAGTAGQGNGTVDFSVGPNPDVTMRRGSVSVAGQRVELRQEPAACQYDVSPSSATIGSGGGSLSVQVGAGAGCGWTAASTASWISVTAGATGNASGTVSLAIAPNLGLARSGSVTVGGHSVLVNQTAAVPGCSYSIAPTSQGIGASGGTGSVSVAAPPGCPWTATASVNWISVTSGASGSGAGNVSFIVAANTGAARSGTLSIAGETFTITQAAAPPGCSFAISPTSQIIGSAGGTGSANVAAGAGCAWSGTSNASWITVTAGGSGSGNGTVTFTIAQNTSGNRTGTLTIADQTFTVIQAAQPCSYSIAPPSQDVAATGATFSVTITTGSGCGWSANSQAAWISVGGSPGSGNGAVTLTVAANSGAQRSSNVTIAGQTFTVSQAAQACSYSIAPTSQAVAAAGGSVSVNVTAGSGCAWTAASQTPWITVSSGSPGSGNGTVGLAVAANSGAARSGSVTIAGQTFTVEQAAAACSYSITPMSQSFPSGGGSGTVNVTAGTGCGWTATSNAPWISVTSGSPGSGNGSINYSVQSNPSSTLRTGTLTIAGRTFTVEQAGTCSYLISPPAQSFTASGGAGSVNVTAGTGCAWSATSNAGWITVTSGSPGTGNGSVNYSVQANSGSARTGTVTIAGQTFTVNQAAPCNYSINPNNQSFTGPGGPGSFNVIAGMGCTWTASPNAPWLTVTPPGSGSGNGSVAFTVAPNTTGSSRSGTITVAGQTFTVMQSTCTFSINPTSQGFGVPGGTGTVNVNTLGGCPWTATSNAPWITVTSGASGSGNGTVGYSVQPRPPGSPMPRMGTITIAGQTFTVNQAANP